MSNIDQEPYKFQLTRDFYLVWVTSVWENKKQNSRIILSATAERNNQVKDQSSIEELEDRGEYKRRHGIVLQVPASFSDYSDHMVEIGVPQPRKYVGHEWIQSMVNGGHRGYRENERPERHYYPSTYEAYPTVKLSDVAKRVNATINDKVYFLHTSTDMERYMGPYKDGHLFSVRVDEILCVTKKSPIFVNHEHHVQEKIYPQGGWVFATLNMETWEEITTPSGIIVKVAPEALPLQGQIVAAQRSDLVPGTNIIFERDADAPITIDGREMTCMREEEILGIIKPK